MRRHGARDSRQGIAMVTVVVFSAALAGFMMLIMLQLQREHRAAETYVGIKAAADAADAGLERAVAALWEQYLQNLPLDEVPVLGGYKAFLNKTLTKANDLLGGPLQLKSGAVIKSVSVERTDAAEGVSLRLVSVAEAHGRERRAVQVLEIGGAAFESFDYALMANNMQCVMCHTVIDNVERVNNTDSANFGTFDRVKIAVLDELNIESSAARTRIAGTIHARGEVNLLKNMVKQGPLKDPRLSGFRAYAVDANGKIREDKKGDLSEDFFSLPGLDLLGLPLPGGNFYMDYPVNPSEMTDGNMPSAIPPVIKDGNGNRQVDDEEWKSHVSASSRGAIGGGLAYGVPTGKTYPEVALPKKGNDALAQLGSGYYDGNVILVGTDSDPIEIKGDVFVNGDVVITGKVKGTGKIQARNNIYFVGDTTMADDDAYGVAKDGTQNLVGYAAGGNIVAGDFITASAHNEKDYGKNKWTQFNQPGDKKKKMAYLNEDTIDKSPPLDKGDYLSWTSQQMMKFNQSEYKKAQQDASYVPRFYRMREGDRTYLYTHEKEERALQYESWLMREMKPEELKRGVVLNMAPAGGWISEDTLKQIWWNDERSRDKDKEAQGFKIDGLLYTNNAIMAMMPTWSKHKSNMYGSLTLRGAAYAADLGIHASGGDGGSKRGFGFEVQYDARVQKLLSVTDVSSLSLKRSVRLFEQQVEE